MVLEPESTKVYSNSMESINGRIAFLDYLKGILIWFVVLGHVIQFVIYNGDQGYWNNYLFKWIYMFHMPLFMAVSGYLTYNSINPTKTRTDYIKKIQQLIIPVITWSIILAVIKRILNRNMFIGDIYFDIMREFTNGFWYLWALMICYLLAMLSKFSKIGKCGLLSIISALFLTPDMGISYLIKYMIPFFFVGYYFKIYENKFTKYEKRRDVLILLILLSIICFHNWNYKTYVYISKMNLNYDNLKTILFRYFASCVVSVSVLFLFYWMFLLGVFKSASLWGLHSLQIYILQTYVFLFVIRLLNGHNLSLFNITISSALAPLVATGLVYILIFVNRLISNKPLLAFVIFGKIRI